MRDLNGCLTMEGCDDCGKKKAEEKGGRGEEGGGRGGRGKGCERCGRSEGCEDAARGCER